MDRLASQYRDKIEAQKFSICIKSQIRAAREGEARYKAMAMRSSEMEILEGA